MTQEDKELLLKDICARLPYDVIVVDHYGFVVSLTWEEMKSFEKGYKLPKPYLRPMSSMTGEERIESLEFACEDDYGRLASYNENIPKYIDFLNAHHFDYRGLIERGLAIEVTKENNPYEDRKYPNTKAH